MADDRKIFPVETVLELVAGKKDADVRELASYILGKTVDNPVCASAAGPFAAAWLARWYPKFMDMEWKEGQSWESFVKQCAASLGNSVSLTPMSGRTKELANQVLDVITDTSNSLLRQTEANVKLEKRIKELEPLEARANSAQKKCDNLENTIKSMKADMGALQRSAAAFQGKLAVDHDELMQNIKDAIKDGLKGLSIGSAVAATVEAATSADATPQEDSVPDDFGFGSSGPDADGFGF